MSALTMTASQVKAGTIAGYRTGTAGESVTAGQAVYLDAITGTLKLAQCDGTQAEAACIGLASHAALQDQPLKIQHDGEIQLGADAAPAVGQVYCVGAPPGSVVPYADLSNGQWVSLLGVGKTGNLLAMALFVSGQLKV